MIRFELTDGLRSDMRTFVGWSLALGTHVPEEFGFEYTNETIRLETIAERDATSAWPLPNLDGLLARLRAVDPDTNWAAYLADHLEAYEDAARRAERHGMVLAMERVLETRLRALHVAAKRYEELLADVGTMADATTEVVATLAKEEM